MDLPALIRKRGTIKGRITRIETFVANSNNIDEIKVRANGLEAALKEFDDVQFSIEGLNPEETDKERVEIEEQGFRIMSKVQSKIKTTASVASSSSVTQTFAKSELEVKLPTLNLQKFKGKYTDWLSFSDNFTSLVHENKSLKNCHKFHYLKSCLEDDALRTIESLAVSSSNYDTAWKLLEKRYKNVRLIVQEHVYVIINSPLVVKNSSSSLRKLIDDIIINIEALKVLEIKVDSWDAILVPLITEKLDYQLKKEWQLELTAEIPKLSQFIDFLEKHCQILESINASNKLTNSKLLQSENTHKNQLSHRFRTVSNVTTIRNKLSCYLCKRAHMMHQCSDFLKLSISDRLTKVNELKLCINCFKNNHAVGDCRAYHTCKTCSQKHNTLLHAENIQQTLHIESVPSTSVSVNSCQSNALQILLPTAVVKVFDKIGKEHHLRALLDSGSQSNFLSEQVARRLKLDYQQANIPIIGINQVVSKIKKSVDIKILSNYNDSFEATLSCLVLPKITGNLPLMSFTASKLDIPKNIQLADPNFNISNEVDILIGSEYFWNLLGERQIQLGRNQPCLQETKLGWVVAGFNKMQKLLEIPQSCNLSLEQVSKFWEVEDYGNKSIMSPDETLCETLFGKSHYRKPCGRFSVQLPFKTELKPLGNSRIIAMQRLRSLETKFKRDHKFKQSYTKVIQKYLELNHAEIVPAEFEKKVGNTFYLPHHAVFKQNSVTTQLRIVFDGSAKTINGCSLNDLLLNGPKLQQNLFHILIRFRKHKIALIGDIEKMYRQIEVQENHRDFQRILWRNETTGNIETYRLTRVTFGMKSSPYLAIKCLQQLARDERNSFPLAYPIILNDFYVDDVLTGAETTAKALSLRQQLTEALARGGFTLRKWASNDQSILVNNNDHLQHTNLNLDKDNSISKTLGLLWNYKLDAFSYSIEVKESPSKITKRNVLSIISQLFDPLGLLAPVLITAKIILQKLWSLQLNWDQPTPLQFSILWLRFVENLPELTQLQIPRGIISISNPIKFELHSFCDASINAFGTCTYLHAIDDQGNHSVRLVCAKSRVAPLKTISLPRLELCGALLAARLANQVTESLNLNISKQYFWTDSMIVLAWLNATPNTWNTFVANRIAEIQGLTSHSNWCHVPTKDNPADLVSRGCSPSQLQDAITWWEGPKWLHQDPINWPINKSKFKLDHVEILEKRKIISQNIIVTQQSLNIFNKYSSFSKLLRVTAYCLRFKHNLASRNNRQTGHLTVSEIENAKITLLKLMQHEEFHSEIHCLKESIPLSRHSKILNLNPFIDKNGLIRVGGRLSNATIRFNKKHPIVLAKNHELTVLIIREEHLMQGHAGPQSTLAFIRQRFWPLSGRSKVRQVIHKCIQCFKVKPTTYEQLMGNLPEHRIEPSRPFINSGLDYAGPIQITETRGRGKRSIKAYIVLFICLATKAVHLELVCDCTTESFLNACKRFMSRRGKISHMYSDNATTFVGADRELRVLENLFKSQNFATKVISQFATEGITWHFIPPRSPNFGGIWEAGIKSTKTHIKRIIGNAILTYEEMYTLLILIESILNSRPLTPLSADPNELNPLTPAHFLIGDSLITPVEPDLTRLHINRLSRWQRIEQLRQQFWKRWSREYLGQLQQRPKWKTPSTPLQEGTMVLIKEDNLPPLQWALGRILHLHAGRDGVARVVTIKTRGGEIKRSIRKVCVLPIEN